MSREDKIAFNQSLFWNNLSSSSSSSSEDEEMENLVNDMFRPKVENIVGPMIPLIQEIVEEGEETSKHGGSVMGRNYVHRDRLYCKNHLRRLYFVDKPIFDDGYFRRRYRMHRHLFLRILASVQEYDNYFVDKKDGIGKWGVSGLQKVLCAVRMLAQGCAADSTDETFMLGESTAIESLMHFCDAVNGVFEERYLRTPTQEDVNRLLEVNEARGFPGMLGSIDCMHWTWKNCPVEWQGSHRGHKKEPTIILEAVADQDLWIWHAFFGVPGSNNDINVLHRSNVFQPLISGESPACNFIVNGNPYGMGYYLADGIYPQWATLIRTIKRPMNAKEKNFAIFQESCRKDVERAFGALQSRFAIVCSSARFWKREDLGRIMKTCVILHNLIVEDEREIGVANWEPPEGDRRFALEQPENEYQHVLNLVNRLNIIQNRATNIQLTRDLMEHLWDFAGEQ